MTNQTTVNVFAKVGYLGGATFDALEDAQAWATRLSISYGPEFRAEYNWYEPTPDGGSKQVAA